MKDKRKVVSYLCDYCLWNDQIASVSAGDTGQIENARVFAFRGERQMSLEKPEYSMAESQQSVFKICRKIV